MALQIASVRVSGDGGRTVTQLAQWGTESYVGSEPDRGDTAVRMSALSRMNYLALAVALGASQAFAQPTLRGTVVDTAGEAIGDVDVGIVALRRLAKTDEHGRFALTDLPTGTLELSLRRLGYEPTRVTILIGQSTDSVRVVLRHHPLTLAAIELEERAMRQLLWIEDFHRRRMIGMGTYLSREEIENRRASRTSDLLRNLPGIRFVAMQGRTGVRFVSAAIQRRDCIPMIWIDGQRAPGMEIDEIVVTNIEGIELYNGPSTTPMRFSQSQSLRSSCGTIVIWSRVPGH